MNATDVMNATERREWKNSAVVAALTLLTLVLWPVLVLLATALYVVTLTGFGVVLFRETGDAIKAWTERALA